MSPPDTTIAGRLGSWVPLVLGMLTIFGPISIDVYLPSLPALGDDLAVPPSLAQLTLTACLVGLAAGQLVVGPLSDRFGRRRPLLIGLSLYVVAAIVCAVSPTIEVLVVARFVQGFAGATGMVIAQASGRDRMSGARLVRYYADLAVILGTAALVAPLVGGQLATILDWRGVFVVLAVVAALVLVACVVGFSESLPSELRAAHGRSVLRDVGSLLGDRGFAAPAALVGLVSGAAFAYVGGAAFILQTTYGLSPQQFSFVLASGSATFVLTGIVAGRVGMRRDPRVLLPFAVALALAGSSLTIAVGILGLDLPVLIAAILLVTSGVGLAAPPATTLALARRPEIAGSAAATLGVTRYAIGAAAAPLVGIAGPPSATQLGVVMLACSAGATLAAIATRRGPREPSTA